MEISPRVPVGSRSRQAVMERRAARAATPPRASRPNRPAAGETPQAAGGGEAPPKLPPGPSAKAKVKKPPALPPVLPITRSAIPIGTAKGASDAKPTKRAADPDFLAQPPPAVNGTDSTEVDTTETGVPPADLKSQSEEGKATWAEVEREWAAAEAAADSLTQSALEAEAHCGVPERERRARGALKCKQQEMIVHSGGEVTPLVTPTCDEPPDMERGAATSSAGSKVVARGSRSSSMSKWGWIKLTCSSLGWIKLTCSSFGSLGVIVAQCVLWWAVRGADLDVVVVACIASLVLLCLAWYGLGGCATPESGADCDCCFCSEERGEEALEPVSYWYCSDTGDDSCDDWEDSKCTGCAWRHCSWCVSWVAGAYFTLQIIINRDATGSTEFVFVTVFSVFGVCSACHYCLWPGLTRN